MSSGPASSSGDSSSGQASGEVAEQARTDADRQDTRRLLAVIAQLARAHGLNNAELAERSGLSPNAVRGLLRGSAPAPQLASVLRLARTVGLRMTAEPEQNDGLLSTPDALELLTRWPRARTARSELVAEEVDLARRGKALNDWRRDLGEYERKLEAREAVLRARVGALPPGDRTALGQVPAPPAVLRTPPQR